MTDDRCRHLGAEGSCYCPKCGTKAPHKEGVRCQQDTCPECGAKMLREGSFHYDMLMKKRESLAKR